MTPLIKTIIISAVIFIIWMGYKLLKERKKIEKEIIKEELKNG